MARIYVGLSGGVDSAVSAALLKEQGHDVTGAFIKIWSPEFLECTWRDDRLDAMRVCAALGIPFREVDLSDAYRSEVIGSMLAAYRAGITPNPDVLCNERIKFGRFAKWAFDAGAEKIATGHYARVEERGGNPELLRGVDDAKDQSYFLHRISRSELARAVFPVGALRKTQVREHAARFGLPVSSKPDSQGLCFVGDVSMRDFLRRFIAVESGPVLDAAGVVVGVHEGAALYTIGQRHGFTVTGSNASTPHFVASIDIPANSISVTADRSSLAKTEVTVTDLHWINGCPTLPLHASIQTRYRDEPAFGNITCIDGEYRCAFDAPHPAVPGQSLVIYDADRCLGGGMISR